MRGKGFLVLGGGLLAAAALPFCFSSLRARWQWEKDRNLEICLDGSELSTLVGNDPAALSRALSRAFRAGAHSVGVAWPGPGGPDETARLWARALPEGMAITLRPGPDPFSSFSPAPPARLQAPFFSKVESVLCAGPQVWGYPDREDLFRWIEGTSWRLPAVEFSRQAGLESLLRRFPARVVRAHSVDEDGMGRMTPETLEIRFRRAARERGARFLYFHFFPGLSAEGNLSALENLCGRLRADGFSLGPAALRGRPPPLGFPAGPRGARQGAAFLAAALLPLWGFRFFTGRRFGVVPSVLGMTLFSLAGALAVAALLSSKEFTLGLSLFRGVKAVILLPLFGAAWGLYGREERARLFRKPLTLGMALAFCLAAGVLAVLVLRSGHDSGLTAGPWEMGARDKLEAFFGVRPRFKEFLLGHPLLWLGFYWRRTRPLSWLTRPFFLGGFIGQISLVNTFCHAHVPLAVSLLRAWHGVWLGAALGGSFICLLEFLSKRRRSRL